MGNFGAVMYANRLTNALPPNTLRGKILRGASVVTMGSLAWQALRLINAMILARLLGPAQFGLASMLLLVITFVDMTSSASLDKQLVQAPDGDSDRFLATTHAFAALRGIVASFLLLIIAYPVAHVFGVPDDTWAFAMLAFVPFSAGFAHFDRKRVQRHLRFAPDMTVEFVAQIGALAVGAALAWKTRHFTASMWGILAGALISLIASFIVAERSYRWAWDRETIRRMFHFGWPLVLSNALLFLIMQGERALLASAPQLLPGSPYTPTDLGLFAAAGTLAYAPVVVITRLGANLSLPLLSSAVDTPGVFWRRFRRVTVLMIGSAIGSVFVFCIFGSALLHLLYGNAYAAATPILTFLAIAQAIRIVRVSPTVGALALGNSRNTLWANVARFLGIGISALVLIFGYSITWLAIASAAGELLSLVVATTSFAKLTRQAKYRSVP